MANSAEASGGHHQDHEAGGGGQGFDHYGGNGDGYDAAYGGPRDVGGFLDNEEGAPPPEKPKEVYVPEDIEDEALFDFQINTGINFNKFDSIPVEVSNATTG